MINFIVFMKKSIRNMVVGYLEVCSPGPIHVENIRNLTDLFGIELETHASEAFKKFREIKFTFAV